VGPNASITMDMSGSSRVWIDPGGFLKIDTMARVRNPFRCATGAGSRLIVVADDTVACSKHRNGRIAVDAKTRITAQKDRVKIQNCIF
jgi:hypothetical protein